MVVSVLLVAALVLHPPCPGVKRSCPEGVAVVEGGVPRGKSGWFSTGTPCVIYVRPGLPAGKQAVVLRHEVIHACRWGNGRSDWAMGEPVTYA